MSVGGRIFGQIFSSNQDLRPDSSSFETGSFKKKKICTTRLNSYHGGGGLRREAGANAGEEGWAELEFSVQLLPRLGERKVWAQLVDECGIQGLL